MSNSLALNTTDNNQTFQAKIFEPYSTMQFTFTGTKSARTKTDTIVVTVVELDLPSLELIFPAFLASNKVNKNEQVQIDVNYPANPDDIFFSVETEIHLICHNPLGPLQQFLTTQPVGNAACQPLRPIIFHASAFLD
jgi:hypothetical protein